MIFGCVLLVGAGSAVTVNVTPSKIDPNGTITVNVTGLEDGARFSLRFQTLFDVPSGATFQYEFDNVTLPICLSDGNITVMMQNTVNNSILIKFGEIEINASGNSVNGVFSHTIPFSDCLNGTFDFIRTGGTAQSFRDNVVSTMTIEGNKTGPDDFEIPITITGLEAAKIGITVLVDGEVVFSGMIDVDSPVLTTGTLFVTSMPAGAEIYLDGLFYGNTPKKISGLPLGVRKVRLVKSGFRTFETTAEITSGFPGSLFASIQSTNTSPFVTLPIGGAFGEQIAPFTPPDNWEVPGFTNGFFTFPLGFITM